MARAKSDISRDKAFKLSLSSSIQSRLQAMADRYGMPYSTMAAFAIGEWLNTKESQLGLNAGIVSGFKESFEEILKAEMATIPQSIKEEQLNLIKD